MKKRNIIFCEVMAVLYTLLGFYSFYKGYKDFYDKIILANIYVVASILLRNK